MLFEKKCTWDRVCLSSANEAICACQVAAGPPCVEQTRRENALRKPHVWGWGGRGQAVLPSMPGGEEGVIAVVF
jgi:hypothetical protein